MVWRFVVGREFQRLYLKGIEIRLMQDSAGKQRL